MTKQPVARLVEAPAEIEPLPQNYLEEEPHPKSDFEGADRLWLLWRNRKFLIRAAAWGLIFSTIVAFLIPKQYKSTTRLMPPDQQFGSGLAMMAAMAGRSSSALGSSALGSLAGDMLGMKSSGALFIEILQSRTVEDRLIERFDLLKEYGTKYKEAARKELARRTSLSEDRKSGVITIEVMDHDRYHARDMAQAYVEELDNLVAQVSTSSARRERIFIEQRLQSVKHDLDTASQQFSQYASQNTTIDITAQAKATVEAAAKLEGELIAAQSELDGLEQIYTNNNVRVRSLQARVDELRAQLHKIGGDSSDPVPSTSSSQQEFPSIRQLPLLGVKWADLYRQTKIEETVYELLTQQYELAKIEEAKEIPVVKVLDAPSVPERKSFPPHMLIGILGMFMSFGLACLWMLGRNYWETIDPANPHKALAQEVCAALVSNVRRLSRSKHQTPTTLAVSMLDELRSSSDKDVENQ